MLLIMRDACIRSEATEDMLSSLLMTSREATQPCELSEVKAIDKLGKDSLDRAAKRHTARIRTQISAFSVDDAAE
jgi:hypothetical protein